MRKIVFLAALVAGIYGAVEWWRHNRRAGAGLMNRVVNTWLERRDLIRASGGELALVEHVGRRTGIVRRTPIHPMPIDGGYRIIVPIGEGSEWARNVLAAGGCRLIVNDEVLQLGEPVLETPDQVPGLTRPVRALFGWLGFRYLHLSVASPARTDAPAPLPEAVPA
jgi:hypothetical protein